MEINKDVIKQIILDFNEFKGRDVWLCSFEDVVEEFINTQELNYLTDREE